MPNNFEKPITVITVLCDARHIQTLRVTCRCGNVWTERVPQELHDSYLIAQFTCSRCERVHLLKNHVLKSYSKEEIHAFERQDIQTAFGDHGDYDGDDSVKYDA